MRIKNPQTGQEMELVNNQWMAVPPPSTAERVQRTIKGTAKEARGEPVDFDLGTMVSNIPSSAKQYGSDIYQALRHPMQTAEGLGTLFKGTVEKGAHELAAALPESLLTAGRPESGVMRAPVWGDEPVAEAAGEALAQRYGGLEELKTTAMQDPVGMLGDVAGVATGIGALPKAGKIGQIGAAIDPLNLATRGASKGLMNLPGLADAPSALYKSAAKLGKKVDQNKVVETALAEGIMPTDIGIDKGREILSGLDSQIDDMIVQSSASGETINRGSLYKYIKEVKQDLGGVNLDAPDNLKKIDKIVNGFDEHMKATGKTELTAAEVQKFKKDIYKSINWKSKQATGTLAGATTRKAMAKAAKEELEFIMPEIKDLNLQMGDMIELLDAIEGPAARISQRDMIGLGMPAKVIAGTMLGDLSGAIGGFLLGIADAPTLKAKLALGLNNIKNLTVGDAQKRVLTIELLRNAGSEQTEEGGMLQ